MIPAPLRSATISGTIAILAAAYATPAPAASPPTGRAAPAFVLQNAAGSDVTLRTFAGKPLVINVFASWCPPCRQELPRIASAARATRGKIAFLGVDEQEPQTMALAFVREMRLPYGIVFDHGQFSASYGADALPETAFIDARGNLVAVFHGAISAAELESDLAKISGVRSTPGRT